MGLLESCSDKETNKVIKSQNRNEHAMINLKISGIITLT